MAGEEKVNNKEGSASNGNLVVALEGKEMLTNASTISLEKSTIGDVILGGSSGDVLRTYKRRKRTNIMEDGKLAIASTSQVSDQAAKEPYYKTLSISSNIKDRLTQMDPHACGNDANGSSPEHWRNVVLEQMSQMLECEGGLRGCIQDSVAYHLEICKTTAVKGSVHSCEKGSQHTSQTGLLHNKLQNGVSGNEGEVFDTPMQKPNRYTGKELCQRTFYDIINSENFTHLCHFLHKSFPGIMVERVLDISSIDSKMKEGAYENSPNLFHADIQQVWTKIDTMGADMVALAKSLSDISRISFREQAGSISLCSTEDEKLVEPNMHDKGDKIEACGVYKVCTCKKCGEKADVKNCLVCDSCEEIYHVACLEPPIEEIPHKSWYCASCTATGIWSPHDGCVVCERMNAPISLNHEGACQESENNEDIVIELEESSNGMLVDEHWLNGGLDSPACIICRSGFDAGGKLKICPHAFCPHKFYHVTCLTDHQLKTHGRQWYCPSCLCRSCLTDCDDDKIVLCDGCDHAYHIYCMQPPRTSVPRGKWYCRKCSADVRCIRQAKRSYENRHHKLKKTAAGGKRVLNVESTEETVADAMDNKSGAMDMLLNAVKTLNYEDMT
ncbi:hypothetical protein LIER_21818 [Lithospermum erythrorhizon]|uniref:PHD-type domain-containing protein n=1 Tax=Lithospermum erythrorhizon TaxID=34254 RepID=A0AAV3QUR4_LITER